MDDECSQQLEFLLKFLNVCIVVYVFPKTVNKYLYIQISMCIVLEVVSVFDALFYNCLKEKWVGRKLLRCIHQNLSSQKGQDIPVVNVTESSTGKCG